MAKSKLFLLNQRSEEFWAKEIGEDYSATRTKAIDLLGRESKLLEIVRLVGMESLSNDERLVLEVARMIREDFLFQNAFDPDDAYTPLERQYGILKSITNFFDAGQGVVSTPDFDFATFMGMESFAEAARLKEKLDWKTEDFAAFQQKTTDEINSLVTVTA